MIATAARGTIFLILVLAILMSQLAYDSYAERLDAQKPPPDAEFIKTLDLGLHSAAASLIWLDIRTELPFLRNGSEYFLSGLKTVNDLNPRWNTPYVFSVLVLPHATSYENRVSEAIRIGERGLASANPDWRIPFYMGAIYQLELNDLENSARYFDLAATTPGIPELVRRFAVNYGIHPKSLEATKQAWTVIHGTSSSEFVRTRAAAHIERLDILQYLNGAVREFYLQEDRYPENLEEVVRSGFLSAIPEDPFGFRFKIYELGVVGIAPANLPE